jgi:SAM-dependent methyltransferase
MKLEPQDIESVAGRTLGHYNNRADDFWNGTQGHDVSQNIRTLLQHIEGEPPFTILDFGCGPGRDLKALTELGHIAVGLDGSARFAFMARDQGFELWEQHFLKLELPSNQFDGIFANASLFHVPSQELPRVLADGTAQIARQDHALLQPNGSSPAPRRSNDPGDGLLSSSQR